MKSKKEIKKKLKKLIDEIDDAHVLNVLNDDIVPYVVKNRTKEMDSKDDLTKEQLKELDEAIDEADRGETVSFEEWKKAMSRWLTK